MPERSIIQPLTPDELRDRAAALEVAYQLIEVTLVDGDTLIGCLAKDWSWDGQTVSLGFNTVEGKRYGHSHIVDIPINVIADIQPIPLSEASIPRVETDDPTLAFLRELGIDDEKYARLPVQDYPNPLASIICEHNLSIVAAHDLPLFGYVERALSTDAIPPEGIEFGGDFLLYADWTFFSQQMSGAVNVSVNILMAGLSKDLSPSLQAEVIKRLRHSWIERVRKRMIPGATREHLMQGRILVPEPSESTEIEGEKCSVVICATTDEKGGEETCPVLLKLNSLKYPLEFLGYITSVLTFYGELLPLPLVILGKTYEKALLARAIGYLHLSEEE